MIFKNGNRFRFDLLFNNDLLFQNEIGVGTRSAGLNLKSESASAESSTVSDRIKKDCPWAQTSYRCNDEQKKYRDIDGSCNSLSGKIIY